MSDSNNFDLQAFLPYLLNQAAEQSSLAFQRSYKNRYNMLRTEWRVMFHLGLFGTMTARDIGVRGKIHKTKISRAVQKLIEKRFILRQRSAEDRRQESLQLTVSGRAAFLELRKTAEQYQTDLSAEFSVEEFALLQTMLKRLIKH
jgi:DNA-binding MarR family transcriptional regulator